MAKNTQAQQSGWTPSFSASSLSSEVPVLTSGVYAGKLTNVTIVGKENKQYFGIRKCQAWNNEQRKFEDVIENGMPTYELSGMIMAQGILTSKKAIETLGRSEPGFFRMININFDSNFNPDEGKNQQFKNFLTVLGLDKEPFESYVNFYFDPDIQVPDELAHLDNAVNMLNALNYYKELFNIICNAAKDQPVRAVVERVTLKDGSVNWEISGTSTNRFSTSCGFLSYENGCENDYIEE